MRILLVEDHPELLKALVEALASEGHEVEVALTFQQGDGMLLGAPSHWQAVVANVRLPGGNGLQLAAKAEQMGIPALLVAGHPEDMIALTARGIRHLQKPFALKALFDWVGIYAKPRASNSSN